MNETQKPFVCSIKNCTMTFTNEDHLICHNKRHEVMLNLGLTKATEIADQTPTPTRFIKNCEELGLFQDLQNVNPFDEVFKKAAEAVKNGTTLEVPPGQNCDDSLHTPHILPHLEERNIKIKSKPDEDSNSNEFLLTVPEGAASTTRDLVVDRLKQKVNKVAQNKGLDNESPPTTAQSPDPRTTLDDPKREKIKEMNRAAQMRCRRRKQEKILQMEAELLALRENNRRLRVKNYLLSIENERLRKIVSGHNIEISGNISTAVEAARIEKGQDKNQKPVIVQVLPVQAVPLPVVPIQLIEEANLQKKSERRLMVEKIK
ncbi:unnamed protein product [Acanthoscelides obtectus]|uniref:Uncharacterized protein n=1 Tax=Acanthoscelides obtectus TaxID=200917 RepID=A0A9P0KQB3_ACAOB|nr:unnamed protein product [Acanthoscelides obtectus]CAK1641917.1 Cyclic AMP-dependent transcription factor ATF-2 [Acanthoscelides obtectus]